YWQHADAVSKTLYFVLLAMSIATWTIFVLRLMGTRQLKQIAYAQLSQALEQLKTKLAPLGFEQRKAVAEQALLRQISAEKANAEKVYQFWVPSHRSLHLSVCSVRYGASSMRWLLLVKVVRLVWHKWQPQSVKR